MTNMSAPPQGRTADRSTPHLYPIPGDVPAIPHQHVMLDLETWSVEPTAAIISIGAVKFNPRAMTLGEKFHVAVSPKSSMAFELHVSAATLEWWMHPDHRTALDQWRSKQQVDLVTALEGFATWFGPTSLPLWGNGATFDNVILRNAYKVIGLKAPWEYQHDRCFRTIKSITPDVAYPHPDELKDVCQGLQHDALYDACAQAMVLQRIANRRNLHLG